MAKMVIIVDEVFRDKVLAAFESFQIQYRIAGYPNGSVVVHETFESKINSMPVEKPKEKTTLKKVVAPIIDKRDEYDRMNEYAKSLGYKNIPEAIGKMNGARNFKKKFKKEYQNS